MTKSLTLSLPLLLAGALAPFASAQDVAAGKAKSATCAACHGADGKAIMPIYPNLNGQNAAYLKIALKAYKNGERKAGQAAIMAGMAAGLSDADIDNLAAYYASLGK
jgi:cytochrome c553